MTFVTTLRHWLDRLALLLPVIMMGALALGSWWLVRSMPVLDAPVANPPVRQDPDYRLVRFSSQVFSTTGRMTRQVSGEQAQHFPATDEMQIDQIRIFAESEHGTVLRAQAQTGTSTGDPSRVTLLGQVLAVRQTPGGQPTELRGERMVAWVNEDQLISDHPVEITRGRDVFKANRMNLNSQTSEYLMQGRVHGILQPKP